MIAADECTVLQFVEPCTTMSTHMEAAKKSDTTLTPPRSEKAKRKLPLSRMKTCTICLRVGHLKRNCPQIRCKGYGLLGHCKEDFPEVACKDGGLDHSAQTTPYSREVCRKSTDGEGCDTFFREDHPRHIKRSTPGGFPSLPFSNGVPAGGEYPTTSAATTNTKAVLTSTSILNSTSDSTVYLCDVCYRCGSSRHQKSSCPVPSEVECRQCHQEGHVIITCPQTRCYNCGAMGHSSQICTSKTHCFHCSVQGHTSFQCPMKNRGRVCYQCKEPGHQAAQCPQGIVCRLCHQEGHIIAHCPSVMCKVCHQLGHMGGDCKQVSGGVGGEEACRESRSSSCTTTTNDTKNAFLNPSTHSSVCTELQYMSPSAFPSPSSASLFERRNFSTLSPSGVQNPQIIRSNSTDASFARHHQDVFFSCLPPSSLTAFVLDNLKHPSATPESEANSLSFTSSQAELVNPTTPTRKISSSSATDSLSKEKTERKISLRPSSTATVVRDTSLLSLNNIFPQKLNGDDEVCFTRLSHLGGGQQGECLPISPCPSATLPAYQPVSSVRKGRVLIVIDGPYFERCVVGYESKSIEQYKRTTFALQQMLAYIGDLFEMEPIGYWFDTNISAFTEFLETGMPLHCREAAFREFGYRRRYLIDEMNSTSGTLHNVVAFLVGFMKRQRGYTPDGPGHVWVQSGVDVAIATCVVEHFHDFPQQFSQVVLLSGDGDIYPAIQYCNTLRLERQRSLMRDKEGVGASLPPPVRVCGTTSSLSKIYGLHQHLFDFLPRILLDEEIHKERGKTFHFSSNILFE